MLNLRITLKLEPYNLGAYETLAELAKEDIIYADTETMDLLEQGVKLFRYDAGLWHAVGAIYIKRGETEYAKTVYKDALAVDTLDKSLRRSLDKLYTAEEEQPEILLQAKQLQGYYDKVQNLRGTSRAGLRQLRSQLEAYMEKYPDDPNGPILLARYFSLTGNDIKSKELLDGVLAKQPDNLSANLALSALLLQAEDVNAAKKYLQNALFYYPGNRTAQNRLQRLEEKQ